MARKYREGLLIEFKPDADVDTWLPGRYVEPALFRGWHIVATDDGTEYELPSARVRQEVE